MMSKLNFDVFIIIQYSIENVKVTVIKLNFKLMYIGILSLLLLFNVFNDFYYSNDKKKTFLIQENAI